MEKIILYHGSEGIIKEPKPNGGGKYNDYGQGFYCTKHLELAKEWAADKDRDGFVNSYELDISGLKILDLNSSDYSILNWIAVLLANRTISINNPIAKDGMKYLIDNYYVDTAGYDLIVGYRADDSYFSFARAFVTNSISLEQLEQSMYLGELGLQYFIKSEYAFHRLKFLEAIPVDSKDYYSLRISRDTKARDAYIEISKSLDTTGTYILDLMRKD